MLRPALLLTIVSIALLPTAVAPEYVPDWCQGDADANCYHHADPWGYHETIWCPAYAAHGWHHDDGTPDEDCTIGSTI